MSLVSNEYNALLSLYNATNGVFWDWERSNNSNIWNFSNPDSSPCLDSWQGIVYDVNCIDSADTCYIVNLELSSMNLTGTLPETIGSYTYLSYLDLSFNNLYSSIPDYTEKLKSLHSLR